MKQKIYCVICILCIGLLLWFLYTKKTESFISNNVYCINQETLKKECKPNPCPSGYLTTYGTPEFC